MLLVHHIKKQTIKRHFNSVNVVHFVMCNSIILNDRLQKFWAVGHILNLAAVSSLQPQTMIL